MQWLVIDPCALNLMYTKATPPLWNPSHFVATPTLWSPSHFVATPPLWNLVYKNHLPVSVRSGSSIQEYSTLSSHLLTCMGWVQCMFTNLYVVQSNPGTWNMKNVCFTPMVAP